MFEHKLYLNIFGTLKKYIYLNIYEIDINFFISHQKLDDFNVFCFHCHI